MPTSEKTRQAIAFGAPVPGASLTMPPKNAAWEQPAQFTKLEDAMYYMMDQLLEPQHLKQLLQIMEAHMPVEAVTRTLLFTGFASGKWSVDLAMLMYKPLMLSLIAIAHRAGLKGIPVVMPKALDGNKKKQFREYLLSQAAKEALGAPLSGTTVAQESSTAPTMGSGFMQKGNI